MQCSVCCVFRAEEATLNDDERARFSDIGDVFAHELLPYMNRCLHALFPPTLIAQTLGVSIADLGKLVSTPQQAFRQNFIITPFPSFPHAFLVYMIYCRGCWQLFGLTALLPG